MIYEIIKLILYHIQEDILLNNKALHLFDTYLFHMDLFSFINKHIQEVSMYEVIFLMHEEPNLNLEN